MPRTSPLPLAIGGEAWCQHLERFSDFANRLPRGRTYVRNGLVCHLAIKKGKVEAIVSGSELYKVTIDIIPLPSARWKNVRQQCAGQIGSMLELLQGHLSSQVMGVVTNPAKGLFPQPGEIKIHCGCPDWADMCKHVPTALYGVGARLDKTGTALRIARSIMKNSSRRNWTCRRRLLGVGNGVGRGRRTPILLFLNQQLTEADIYCV